MRQRGRGKRTVRSTRAAPQWGATKEGEERVGDEEEKWGDLGAEGEGEEAC